MSTKTMLKPVKRIVKDVVEAVDTGRDALDKTLSSQSRHLDHWKSDARRLAGATMMAALFGGFAAFSWIRMMDSAKRHQAWKLRELKLDSALDDTMDASDPISHY